MNKLLVITLLTIALCSCETENNSKNNTINSSRFEYDGGAWWAMEYSITEKTIDSCEYIIIFGENGRDIIHKANCKNNFHNQ